MTPPILARVAQLHGSSDGNDCNTISTTTSWEYVAKSSSLSDLTRLGAAFLSPSPNNQDHTKPEFGGHSSSVLHTSQNPLARSLLPFGIVPLPPPHKHGQINGFHSNWPQHGYRLTQKDLLQPSTTGDSGAPPPPSHGSDIKNDSNPVMRSTSFNLDYGAAAAKRQNLKYRQPLNGNRPSRVSQSQFSTSGKPRQQAIVLVAENPESGQSDVYNVPFSSDIYSLPVDSILTASSGNKDPKKSVASSKIIRSDSSCANISQSQTNLNQRLKSETITSNNAVTPPPPRKSNLSRRTSCGSDIIANEHGTKVHNNLSSHSRDLNSSTLTQQEQQRQSLISSSTHLIEPEPCKPPQRSSSLSAQPQPPPTEIPTSSSTKAAFAHIAPPPPLPIPSNKTRQSSSSVVSTQPATSEFKPIPPERTSTANITNNVTRTSTTGQTLSSSKILPAKGPVNGGNDVTSTHLHSVKKPRSRSVDPASELERECHARTSIKRTVDATFTSNINFNDNPSNNPSGESSVVLPPAPTESENSGIFSGSSKEHSTTADRKNPLGISLLNLFRRNKGGPSIPDTGVKQSSQLLPKSDSPESNGHQVSHNQNGNHNGGAVNILNINNNKEDTSYYFRELPPPPPGQHSDSSSDEHTPAASPMECRDFAASIEKVKDCGWYWGPLSSEAAEDLLKNEPDGSFIVRDSSDARYIFSLTFKLHGLVRHVRIEHDQGNFSFGPLTRFKAATIVDFVEKAVAHSRSGRYLFFLHRRPVLGPMQVQLLHPYSRFMHARSLKHMCRFVILKYVRRDLIHTLPLPKPMQDYLNTPHYYFEPPDRSSGGGRDAATTSAETTTSHHHSRLA